MLEKDPARRRAGTIIAAFAVVAVGILAYGLGRSRREATRHGSLAGPPEAPIAASPAGESSPPVPLEPPGTPEPLPQEMSAVFERPMPTPAFPVGALIQPGPPDPPDPPPAEVFSSHDPPDADDCLRVQAAPSGVNTSRAVTTLVEVTVWVENSCHVSFDGSRIGFRVSATSIDGFELGSAVGSFSGEVRAFGSARAIVNVLCDPTRVARYRAELY